MKTTHKIFAGLMSGAVAFAIPLAAESTAQANTNNAPYPSKDYPKTDAGMRESADARTGIGARDSQYSQIEDESSDRVVIDDPDAVIVEGADLEQDQQDQWQATDEQDSSSMAATEDDFSTDADIDSGYDANTDATPGYDYEATTSTDTGVEPGLGAHGPNADLPETDRRIANSTLSDDFSGVNEDANVPTTVPSTAYMDTGEADSQADQSTDSRRDIVITDAERIEVSGAEVATNQQANPDDNSDQDAQASMNQQSSQDGDAQASEDSRLHLVAASNVIGEAVVGQNGEELGSVSDFAVRVNDDGTQESFVVISRGGVLGIGGSDHHIPAAQVSYDRDNHQYNTQLTKENLKSFQKPREEQGSSIFAFSEIEDEELDGQDNSQIGEIEDLLVTFDGKIAYVMASPSADPFNLTGDANSPRWAVPAASITNVNEVGGLETELTWNEVENADDALDAGWVSVQEDSLTGELYYIVDSDGAGSDELVLE